MTATRLNPTDIVMMQRGTATDADDCTLPGMYDIRASCTNVPTGVSWSPLLVLNDGVNLTQLVPYASNLYFRRRGSGSVWGSWVKVTGAYV